MKAEEFGKYLRSIRKRRKLTIRQLELYSGVSNGYLSQLETGKRGIPSPDILKKISDPLGIAYEELMLQAGYLNELSKAPFDWLLGDGSKFKVNESDLNEEEAQFIERIRKMPKEKRKALFVVVQSMDDQE